jgi:dipeptidyl aminopeptidase/acylaminoacyl peptidase
MFDYGDLFKVGVSVCGNHVADNYYFGWSDKYRGMRPAAGFDEAANVAVAHRLQGNLLLISGDMDENVNVSHTMAVVDALIKANREFDLLIVPNAGHGVLNEVPYAMRRAWDYFVRHLLGDTPPAGFRLEISNDDIARYNKAKVREWR